MATITFCGESYTVDHAVKGENYIHGYNANGVCIVAFEDVTDLNAFTYDGVFLAPEDCAAEACNRVVYCGGKLQTIGGTTISGILFATLPVDGWEEDIEDYTWRARQTIAVDGILETDWPLIDLHLDGLTEEDEDAVAAGWASLVKIITGDGTITAYMCDIPDVDIPIKIRR